MIFLDNASTTKIYKESQTIFNEINENSFFNPSALYKPAVDVNVKIYNSKKELLKLLGASMFDNIIFTSGATESDNYAIKGVLRKNMGKLVFSAGEHAAVFETASELKNLGYAVEFVSLKANGCVDEEDFKEKIKGAAFVSIIHVSNETGAINDIKYLVKLAKQENKNIIFHSDGVQALGKIDVNLADLGVDLYTISSHKVHGPKGVGALYVKNNIRLKPLLLGGGQEDGNRAGTENTAGILAFVNSCKIICSATKNNYHLIQELKNKFISLMETNFNNFKLNSNKTNSSPYVVSFALVGIKAETILHMLEKYEIYIGTGSACSSKNIGNRVLNQMHIPLKVIQSSVRISFNENNTTDEVEKLVEALKEINNQYLKY